MTARLTALAALLALSLPAVAKPLTVCTEASPEGFDVVRYNSLTTTNASADVLFNRLVDYDARQGKVVPSLASAWKVAPDGLYRQLMALQLRLAREAGLKLHYSSGAGDFKRRRGGEAHLEYNAVFAHHLHGRHRLALTTLAALLQRAATPLLQRYG